MTMLSEKKQIYRTGQETEAGTERHHFRADRQNTAPAIALAALEAVAMQQDPLFK
jgi:mannose-1-phosphate guanylyltransferase